MVEIRRGIQPAYGPSHRFRLQGDVLDSESLGEQHVAGIEYRFPLAQVPHYQMGGEHGSWIWLMTLTELATSAVQQFLDFQGRRHPTGVLDLAIHRHTGIVIIPIPMFELSIFPIT